jgi:RES domain-containing protein
MRGFRIAAARFARSRKAAFSGQGGVRASARWHTVGQPIVYTSQSLSLAALEILVHLKQTEDLQPFRVFIVEVPG